MSLEAPSGYAAAPTLPLNVDQAWLAAARLPHFLFPAGVLDKYNVVGPILEAAFIGMEHC